MLSSVKQSLRIKSSALDVEIQGMIESAKLDMAISGVKKIDESNHLIHHAIILYCKANFGLDNKDSEKYQKSYDLLVQRLTLCGDYNI